VVSLEYTQADAPACDFMPLAVAKTVTESRLYRHVYASLDESLGCWVIQYSIEVPFAAARERIACLCKPLE
jgi:hypothetical protein